MPTPAAISKKQAKSHAHYANICGRALEVGLRVAEEASMDADTTVRFLAVLDKQIDAMRQKNDVEPDFVDRAVNAALRSEEPV